MLKIRVGRDENNEYENPCHISFEECTVLAIKTNLRNKKS
jgi:hypothetical protein